MNVEKINALVNAIRALNDTPLAGDVVELALAALKAEIALGITTNGPDPIPADEVKVDAQSEQVADKPKQTRAKKAAKVQPEAAKAEPSKSLFEATDEAPEVEAEDVPTVAELQGICLAMVRANRSKKGPIKAVIQSFGGKTIEEVDASKYVELKAALEDL